MSEEEIKVEEEETNGEKGEKITSEELVVKGEEVVESVKKLIHEAGVRRIVIKYKDGRTILEIPLVLGLAGIALLPVWSALALIAALVTECTILVERVEKEAEESAEESESSEDDTEAAEATA
ncbi:MAG: DUF4342 domain-containing protein [Chloroflexota bacterium]|jgi:hypothetical protein